MDKNFQKNTIAGAKDIINEHLSEWEASRTKHGYQTKAEEDANVVKMRARLEEDLKFADRTLQLIVLALDICEWPPGAVDTMVVEYETKKQEAEEGPDGE